MVDQDRRKQYEIARKLANVPIQKRAALLKLLQKEGIDPVKLAIVPADRQTQTLPLSWAQERLWFMDQLEGPSPTYNLPALFRVQGSLHIEALQQALNAVVQRHEVLRTTFSIVDSKPVQVIHPQGSWPLHVENWQETRGSPNGQPSDPDPNLDATIQTFARQAAEKPFDLTTGPLIRAYVMQISPTDVVLLLNRHHIVWDGWSTGLFLQELLLLYQAYSRDQPPHLPPLPIQYGDYAIWQRQWFIQASLNTQLAYWQQQLAGSPPCLQLPTDRPRPSVQTFRGQTHRIQIDPELTQRLQQLSQQTGKTLFMTVFAGFVTLIYRYSHQRDIVIGSPAANRNHPDLESLIGFFVNTIVLRIQVEGNPTFLDILDQVRAVTVTAYANQEVPFEQVVAALRLERDPSYAPLYQIRFVWQQDMPDQGLVMENLTLTPIPLDTGTAKFDLLIDLTREADRIEGFWEYNSDLFDHATIVRLAGYFETLLQRVVAHPDQPINDLPLLSQTQLEQTSQASLQKLKQVKRRKVKT